MRALFCLLAVAACAPETKKCADGTLFVALTLEGGAEAADTLSIDVAVGSGTPVHTTLAHRPGAASGGVQIEFPAGYPKGSSVTVSVTASVGGAILGSNSASATLAGQCERTPLAVGGANDLGSDLSSRTDLAGADLAGTDLASVDLTSLDLAGADLVCVPVTEDCFNGVDDDCDGLVDCADPDCTGGAQCVPDPAGAAPGTLLQGSGACPSPYPTKTPLGANFTAGSCAMGSCAASGPILGECTVTFEDATSDSSCTCAAGSCPTTSFSSTVSCVQFPITDSHFKAITTQTWSVGTRSSCPVTGTPQKTPGSFGTNDTMCESAKVGGGCGIGQVCVPTATNHCVMLPGSQVACPTGYTNGSPKYFKTKNETLSCACSFNPTPGDCTSAAVLTDSGCSTSFGSPGASCNNAAWSGYFIRVSRSAGTCAPGVQTNGVSQATDEQTVCCVP